MRSPDCYWCNKLAQGIEKDESKYCPWHRYTMISVLPITFSNGEHGKIHRMAYLFESMEALARESFEAGYKMGQEDKK